MESGARDHEVKEVSATRNDDDLALPEDERDVRGAAAMFEGRKIDGMLTETQAVH
jgi:hypothetical protein